MTAEIDPKSIRHAEAVAKLKESLGALAADDPDLMADSIEGETGFYEAVDAIVAGMDDDQILLDGIKARKDELASREARIKKRVEYRRGLIEQMMAVSGERKIERPTFTASLSARPVKPVINDEAEIPSQFWKSKPVLDRTALNNALKNGESVPGACLDNGGESLTLRWK